MAPRPTSSRGPKRRAEPRRPKRRSSYSRTSKRSVKASDWLRPIRSSSCPGRHRGPRRSSDFVRAFDPRFALDPDQGRRAAPGRPWAIRSRGGNMSQDSKRRAPWVIFFLIGTMISIPYYLLAFAVSPFSGTWLRFVVPVLPFSALLLLWLWARNPRLVGSKIAMNTLAQEAR